MTDIKAPEAQKKYLHSSRNKCLDIGLIKMQAHDRLQEYWLTMFSFTFCETYCLFRIEIRCTLHPTQLSLGMVSIYVVDLYQTI